MTDASYVDNLRLSLFSYAWFSPQTRASVAWIFFSMRAISLRLAMTSAYSTSISTTLCGWGASGGVPHHGVSNHGQSPSGAAEFFLQLIDKVRDEIAKPPTNAAGHVLHLDQPIPHAWIQIPRLTA